MIILGEIRTLVEELKETAGNSDLPRKIFLGDKLATYNWNLAEEVGKVYGEANDLEYEYKTSLVRAFNKMTGAQNTKESLAKEQLEGLYKAMVTKQNLLKRLQLLHTQTNVVIEQNRQAVAYLRVEFRQTGNG